jgi:NAD(P)-dependent dehydrogenase (short-subunit alcohol dehydrogenase family)
MENSMENTMNSIDIAGKVAVVNGASRGIGEAIARALAACGARVVLSSRRLDGVQKVADSIVAEGGKAFAFACHAGHLDEIDALFEFVGNQFGRLDILINNAATNPYFGPAAELSPEAFDKTVDVNLKGPYFMISRAVPLMAESGGGSIVNVASIAALMSLPGQAVYAMTKAGLISVTKSFAREYGVKGIRVNAILPGVVETRLAAGLVDDPSVQKWLSRIPAGRVGQPQDMVGGVLYLVSGQAAYTTGTTLVMDGGATLG